MKKSIVLLLVSLLILTALAGCGGNDAETDPVGLLPDNIDAPPVVLEAAIDWVKGDYEGYRDIGLQARKDAGAEFDDWRLDYLEPAYAYDELKIEVYRFQWRIHTTTPEIVQTTLVGGMELDDEGWFLDTYPDSYFLFFDAKSDDLAFLGALMENDCEPGDEVFTGDMYNQLDKWFATDQAFAYFTIFNDLYANDEALNSEITYITLDLTQSKQENPARLIALMDSFCQKNGFTLLLDTIEGLTEKGYIKDLYFEEGIVISYEDQLSDQTSLITAAQKWRSGLGAIGADYSVRLKDNVWEITAKTNEWIS